MNIRNEEEVKAAFTALMKLDHAKAVLMQEQLSGREIFIGASKEEPFGHVILCGLGGIFVEVFSDISSALSPVSKEEALSMIRHLKSYPILKGARGQAGIDINLFADIITRLSALLETAPEIQELDINPLLAEGGRIVAVDGRVKF